MEKKEYVKPEIVEEELDIIQALCTLSGQTGGFDPTNF